MSMSPNDLGYISKDFEDRLVSTADKLLSDNTIYSTLVNTNQQLDSILLEMNSKLKEIKDTDTTIEANINDKRNQIQNTTLDTEDLVSDEIVNTELHPSSAAFKENRSQTPYNSISFLNKSINLNDSKLLDFTDKILDDEDNVHTFTIPITDKEYLKVVEFNITYTQYPTICSENSEDPEIPTVTINNYINGKLFIIRPDPINNPDKMITKAIIENSDNTGNKIDEKIIDVRSSKDSRFMVMKNDIGPEFDMFFYATDKNNIKVSIGKIVPYKWCIFKMYIPDSIEKEKSISILRTNIETKKFDKVLFCNKLKTFFILDKTNAKIYYTKDPSFSISSIHDFTSMTYDETFRIDEINDFVFLSSISSNTLVTNTDINGFKDLGVKLSKIILTNSKEIVVQKENEAIYIFDSSTSTITTKLGDFHVITEEEKNGEDTTISLGYNMIADFIEYSNTQLLLVSNDGTKVYYRLKTINKESGLYKDSATISDEISFNHEIVGTELFISGESKINIIDNHCIISLKYDDSTKIYSKLFKLDTLEVENTSLVFKNINTVKIYDYINKNEKESDIIINKVYDTIFGTFIIDSNKDLYIYNGLNILKASVLTETKPDSGKYTDNDSVLYLYDEETKDSTYNSKKSVLSDIISIETTPIGIFIVTPKAIYEVFSNKSFVTKYYINDSNEEITSVLSDETNSRFLIFTKQDNVSHIISQKFLIDIPNEKLRYEYLDLYNGRYIFKKDFDLLPEGKYTEEKYGPIINFKADMHISIVDLIGGLYSSYISTEDVIKYETSKFKDVDPLKQHLIDFNINGESIQKDIHIIEFRLKTNKYGFLHYEGFKLRNGSDKQISSINDKKNYIFIHRNDTDKDIPLSTYRNEIMKMLKTSSNIYQELYKKTTKMHYKYDPDAQKIRILPQFLEKSTDLTTNKTDVHFICDHLLVVKTSTDNSKIAYIVKKQSFAGPFAISQNTERAPWYKFFEMSSTESIKKVLDTPIGGFIVLNNNTIYYLNHDKIDKMIYNQDNKLLTDSSYQTISSTGFKLNIVDYLASKTYVGNFVDLIYVDNEYQTLILQYEHGIFVYNCRKSLSDKFTYPFYDNSRIKSIIRKDIEDIGSVSQDKLTGNINKFFVSDDGITYCYSDTDNTSDEQIMNGLWKIDSRYSSADNNYLTNVTRKTLAFNVAFVIEDNVFMGMKKTYKTNEDVSVDQRAAIVVYNIKSQEYKYLTDITDEEIVKGYKIGNKYFMVGTEHVFLYNENTKQMEVYRTKEDNQELFTFMQLVGNRIYVSTQKIPFGWLDFENNIVYNIQPTFIYPAFSIDKDFGILETSYGNFIKIRDDIYDKTVTHHYIGFFQDPDTPKLHNEECTEEKAGPVKDIVKPGAQRIVNRFGKSDYYLTQSGTKLLKYNTEQDKNKAETDEKQVTTTSLTDEYINNLKKIGVTKFTERKYGLFYKNKPVFDYRDIESINTLKGLRKKYKLTVDVSPSAGKTYYMIDNNQSTFENIDSLTSFLSGVNYYIRKSDIIKEETGDFIKVETTAETTPNTNDFNYYTLDSNSYNFDNFNDNYKAEDFGMTTLKFPKFKNINSSSDDSEFTESLYIVAKNGESNFISLSEICTNVNLEGISGLMLFVKNTENKFVLLDMSSEFPNPEDKTIYIPKKDSLRYITVNKEEIDDINNIYFKANEFLNIPLNRLYTQESITDNSFYNSELKNWTTSFEPIFTTSHYNKTTEETLPGGNTFLPDKIYYKKRLIDKEIPYFNIETNTEPQPGTTYYIPTKLVYKTVTSLTKFEEGKQYFDIAECTSVTFNDSVICNGVTYSENENEITTFAINEKINNGDGEVFSTILYRNDMSYDSNVGKYAQNNDILYTGNHRFDNIIIHKLFNVKDTIFFIAQDKKDSDKMFFAKFTNGFNNYVKDVNSDRIDFIHSTDLTKLNDVKLFNNKFGSFLAFGNKLYEYSENDEFFASLNILNTINIVGMEIYNDTLYAVGRDVETFKAYRYIPANEEEVSQFENFYIHNYNDHPFTPTCIITQKDGETEKDLYVFGNGDFNIYKLSDQTFIPVGNYGNYHSYIYDCKQLENDEIALLTNESSVTNNVIILTKDNEFKYWNNTGYKFINNIDNSDTNVLLTEEGWIRPNYVKYIPVITFAYQDSINYLCTNMMLEKTEKTYTDFNKLSDFYKNNIVLFNRYLPNTHKKISDFTLNGIVFDETQGINIIVKKEMESLLHNLFLQYEEYKNNLTIYPPLIILTSVEEFLVLNKIDCQKNIPVFSNNYSKLYGTFNLMDNKDFSYIPEKFIAYDRDGVTPLYTIANFDAIYETSIGVFGIKGNKIFLKEQETTNGFIFIDEGSVGSTFTKIIETKSYGIFYIDNKTVKKWDSDDGIFRSVQNTITGRTDTEITLAEDFDDGFVIAAWNLRLFSMDKYYPFAFNIYDKRTGMFTEIIANNGVNSFSGVEMNLQYITDIKQTSVGIFIVSNLKPAINSPIDIDPNYGQKTNNRGFIYRVYRLNNGNLMGEEVEIPETMRNNGSDTNLVNNYYCGGLLKISDYGYDYGNEERDYIIRISNSVYYRHLMTFTDYQNVNCKLDYDIKTKKIINNNTISDIFSFNQGTGGQNGYDGSIYSKIFSIVYDKNVIKNYKLVLLMRTPGSLEYSLNPLFPHYGNEYKTISYNGKTLSNWSTYMLGYGGTKRAGTRDKNKIIFLNNPKNFDTMYKMLPYIKEIDDNSFRYYGLTSGQNHKHSILIYGQCINVKDYIDKNSLGFKNYILPLSRKSPFLDMVDWSVDYKWNEPIPKDSGFCFDRIKDIDILDYNGVLFIKGFDGDLYRYGDWKVDYIEEEKLIEEAFNAVYQLKLTVSNDSKYNNLEEETGNSNIDKFEMREVGVIDTRCLNTDGSINTSSPYVRNNKVIQYFSPHNYYNDGASGRYLTEKDDYKKSKEYEDNSTIKNIIKNVYYGAQTSNLITNRYFKKDQNIINDILKHKTNVVLGDVEKYLDTMENYRIDLEIYPTKAKFDNETDINIYNEF